MRSFFVLALNTLFFIQLLHAKAPTAYVSYAAFFSPAKGPFLETYVSVIGNTVVFVKNDKGKFQGILEVSLKFKQAGELKAVRDYVLFSPEITDTSKGRVNFIDQQRISLPNGEYDLELSILDKHRQSYPFIAKQKIIIDIPADKTAISDIELLESYEATTVQNPITKNGYDLVPYVSNFYPVNLSKLAFYAEVYHTEQVLGTAEKFLITYYIESYETGVRLNTFNGFSKQGSGNVNVLLAELPIADLASGNYNLVVEAKDKNNQSLTIKKIFFQRSNPQAQLSLKDIASVNIGNTFVRKMKDKDTLMDYIRCIRPLSTETEKLYAQNLVAGNDLTLMQQYFYNFWKNQDPLDPEAAWLKYHKQVLIVNDAFGTAILKGYDTDRGRVFLQYGAPDSRNEFRNEPSAYPYEVWHYYKLTNQSNKRFVFYNPDLVSNSYRLIHSDVRGETYNTQWELMVHKRDTPSNNLDSESSPSHYGGKAGENFKLPQ